MKSWMLFIVLLLASALVWVSCSSDTTEPEDTDYTLLAEGSIGSDGDSINVPGEITLTIPAGALDSTIDFAIKEHNVFDSIGGTKVFLSSVYTIEPAGTQFINNAAVTIHYEDTGLGSADESSIEIYTNSGNGWSALTSVAYETGNYAIASISHLSDFAAVVDTAFTYEPANGVFAELVVSRMIIISGDTINNIDNIQARFDSAYAPCEGVQPLQADYVICNNDTLTWNSILDFYNYYDPYRPLDFDLGETFTFDVIGNDIVPSLTDSIDFPISAPYITSPEDSSDVSLDGFDVIWDEGAGDGFVELILFMGGVTSTDSVVWDSTANDGSYSFTGEQFSSLQPGTYALLLNHYNKDFIEVEGYDSRSFIAARVMHMITVYLQEP